MLSQSAIIHPGLFHSHRAYPGKKLSLRQISIPDCQTASSFINVILVLLKIFINLILNCTLEHFPRSLP